MPFLRDSASVPPQSGITNNKVAKYVGMPGIVKKAFMKTKMLIENLLKLLPVLLRERL